MSPREFPSRRSREGLRGSWSPEADYADDGPPVDPAAGVTIFDSMIVGPRSCGERGLRGELTVHTRGHGTNLRTLVARFGAEHWPALYRAADALAAEALARWDAVREEMPNLGMDVPGLGRAA